MTIDAGLAYRAALRRDFYTFLMQAFATLNPGAKFRPNWHLEAMCYQLSRAFDGDLKRLVITMPPRSLKSITVSVAWVAWCLGHDPRLRFVCVSYSGDLARKHARDCRKIMTSSWYTDLFRKTRLEREVESDLVTTAGGGRYATSVGGTLTGRGGDVIIIDDPIKPDDAATQLGRDNNIEWFRSTLSSRLDDKVNGVLILVMQRVHEDDLAGLILEAGDCFHLNLPAIAQRNERVRVGKDQVYPRREGEALHPAHEPLAVLNRLRRELGPVNFEAQYQQNPQPAEGAMIRRAWLKRFDDPPSKTGRSRFIQSWDCASKIGILNDYSVCVTALQVGSQFFIIDVFRARLEFPDLRDKAIELARRHPADVILIEDAAAGQQLIQVLQREAPQGVRRPIAVKPISDKTSRVYGVSGMIEAGELVLPNDALWLPEFERELLAFPNGRHDDQVDALAQALTWAKDEPVLPPAFPGVIMKPPGESFMSQW